MCDGHLVHRIASGDPRGFEELYTLLVLRLRPQIAYRLGAEDADDIVHETLMIAVEYIRSGELKYPHALRSFLQTIVRRLIAARILQAIRTRRRTVDMSDALPNLPARGNPETDLMTRQRSALMESGLKILQARDRELMTRFYIHGQPFRDICRDMNLTETQFRLFKNRAKAKLSEWARHRH